MFIPLDLPPPNHCFSILALVGSLFMESDIFNNWNVSFVTMVTFCSCAFSCLHIDMIV